MYLFKDTETTGVDNGARICQLGAILTDADGKTLGELNTLIKIGDTPIHPMAFAAHGITAELANKYGWDIDHALMALDNMAAHAERTIAHNLDFDRRMLKLAYDRTTWVGKIITMPSVCTMKMSTDVCKIPAAKSGTKYKWPKLQEVHKFLFGVEFEGAHDAMEDIRATARVFFELKKRGVIRV